MFLYRLSPWDSSFCCRAPSPSSAAVQSRFAIAYSWQMSRIRVGGRSTATHAGVRSLAFGAPLGTQHGPAPTARPVHSPAVRSGTTRPARRDQHDATNTHQTVPPLPQQPGGGNRPDERTASAVVSQTEVCQTDVSQTEVSPAEATRPHAGATAHPPTGAQTLAHQCTDIDSRKRTGTQYLVTRRSTTAHHVTCQHALSGA